MRGSKDYLGDAILLIGLVILLYLLAKLWPIWLEG